MEAQAVNIVALYLGDFLAVAAIVAAPACLQGVVLALHGEAYGQLLTQGQLFGQSRQLYLLDDVHKGVADKEFQSIVAGIAIGLHGLAAQLKAVFALERIAVLGAQRCVQLIGVTLFQLAGNQAVAVVGHITPLVGNGVVCIALCLEGRGILAHSGSGQGRRNRGNDLAGVEGVAQVQILFVVAGITTYTVNGVLALANGVAFVGLQVHIHTVAAALFDLVGFHKLVVVVDVAILVKCDLVQLPAAELHIAGDGHLDVADIFALFQALNGHSHIAGIRQQLILHINHSGGLADALVAILTALCVYIQSVFVELAAIFSLQGHRQIVDIAGLPGVHGLLVCIHPLGVHHLGLTAAPNLILAKNGTLAELVRQIVQVNLVNPEAHAIIAVGHLTGQIHVKPSFLAVYQHQGVVSKGVAIFGDQLIVDIVFLFFVEYIVAIAVDIEVLQGVVLAIRHRNGHLIEPAAHSCAGDGHLNLLNGGAGVEIAAKYQAFRTMAPLHRKVSVHHIHVYPILVKLIAVHGHKAIPDCVILVLQEGRLFYGHTGFRIANLHGQCNHVALQHRYPQLVDLHAQSRCVQLHLQAVYKLQIAVGELVQKIDGDLGAIFGAAPNILTTYVERGVVEHKTLGGCQNHYQPVALTGLENAIHRMVVALGHVHKANDFLDRSAALDANINVTGLRDFLTHTILWCVQNDFGDAAIFQQLVEIDLGVVGRCKDFQAKHAQKAQHQRNDENPTDYSFHVKYLTFLKYSGRNLKNAKR